MGLLSREGQSWPQRPALVDTSAIVGVRVAERMGSALAFAGKEDAGAALLIANDRLFPVTSTREWRFVALGELTLTQGAPLAVASISMGSWYVAVLTDQGTSSCGSIDDDELISEFSGPANLLPAPADVLGRVPGIDHQRRVLDDPVVVVGRMVGGDQHAVLRRQVLGRQRLAASSRQVG